ncbi:bifunctional demethylmenaquinone methyltransferase/2-methoxy-6-polyprenyl-1,4-benzoquinol methylase UbiE [Porphyromonas sp. HMSC065F10]|uniref:bifunctional demethylmenaquinone methyltransferase/2-methoxy-6-polyprenyl-1,4-benzoquinol methylase UbiE n=1 Tax=Porphyromonas sp. HMSC065F10 TaxID=1739394 RepID=UPI0008A11EBA|nr:bifunctional demethylmenaquinone methyltransferase/2-methoxy-6-polyprenyl-1,4-benzoquinol methylase UbiE [Porphyromonas sp. HMSC065F10]OFR40418.1 hypothetical protein HMPREF2890_01405 [Porphyromonas sp. HMSC065F10]
MASEPRRESPAFSTQVRQMFDHIAPQYDLLNKLNSLGLDRHWRQVLVQSVAGSHPRQILDVATGTGDVAIALARACPEAQVTGMDLSREMMAVGVRKVEAAGLADRIGFGVGDALNIDLPDEAVDAVTCAFGVRNFASLEQGYREFARVLRPGGIVAVLELTEPESGLLHTGYRLYTRLYLRRMAQRYSEDPEAYDYLLHSIARVPSRERMTALMEQAGLEQCHYRIFFPGVCGLYLARKGDTR